MPAHPGTLAPSVDPPSLDEPRVGVARALRSDAVQNRRRVLDAAAAIFAEDGVDVPISRIAQAAGVGQATVFRSFPTKADLIGATLLHQFDKLASIGRELVDSDEPGALAEFLGHFVRMNVENIGLFRAAPQCVLTDEDARCGYFDLLEVTVELVARARARSAIRDDVTADDILLLGSGIATSVGTLHPIAPELWRRYVAITLAGLRPEAQAPLPAPAPTRAQVDEMVARKHARRDCDPAGS